MTAIDTMFDLSGKTILVTGGASGLGLAIAEVVGVAGARVFLTDVNEDALQAQLPRLRESCPDIDGARLDVSEVSAVDALVDALVAQHGRLDCVFANAGVSAGRGLAVEAGQLA